MAMCRTMALMMGLVLVRAMDSSTSHSKCDVPLRHYTELDCKPVYGSNSCPDRFECSSMLARADDKKCYIKSKAYDKGEKLDNHECSIDCSCQELDSGKVGFRCAVIEPCYIDWSKPCVYQYALGDCCHNKIICDPEEKAALATCDYGNKTYREGERIYPEDSCTTCICGKGFDGTLKSLQCLEQSCQIEVHNGNVVKEECAPIYYESLNCCPIYWRCPESGDKIVKKDDLKKSDDPKMKCKYGKDLLDIGDEVETTDEVCVKCQCIIPPLVSCTKARECY